MRHYGFQFLFKKSDIASRDGHARGEKVFFRAGGGGDSEEFIFQFEKKKNGKIQVLFIK